MGMTGARYIVEFLKRQGVRVVAGIPGGSILPLYDAFADSGVVRHVLTRHEQGAGFLAQGMARLSGKPGVCMATSGPGATNLVTAIADARRDAVPLVCLTGQVPRSMLGTEAFQEVDIVAITQSITKWSVRVDDANQLPEFLAKAFALAAAGRPGPVLLDIPRDVQSQVMGTHPFLEVKTPDTPAPDANAVARAAEIIRTAKRPMLLLGGGAVRAASQALALAEKVQMPVTATLMGLGAIPAGHPLSLGLHGMHGHAWANQALDECDALVAVGNRFDDRATGVVSTFCRNARLIHINLDAGEMGRILNPEVAIVADSAKTLSALADALAPQERQLWLNRIRTLREAAPQTGEKPQAGHARHVIAAVADRVDENSIIVTDVGQHQMFVAQHFPFAKPGRWLTSGGLGVMGFGLPAAIGASLADPEARVVLFTGDGSLKMNIQELATLAETGANVKIVVLDNQSLGLVVQQQKLFFGRKSQSSYSGQVDFAALAQAFGVRGVDLDEEKHPAQALSDALDQEGPCLIHARVDSEAMVFPMVPAGAANTEMIHCCGIEADSSPASDDLPQAVNMG
ncbi:acetolactate synthase large subunit [Fundidesulfovibrio butyratiphilus]